MASKVLIVDDSSTARRLIMTHLENMNLDFLEANDGAHGIEILESNPDTAIIFSDINMPVLNGLDMISKIKKDPRWNQIPICLLTTETSSDALSKAKELGVNAFLVKPVRKEQVLAVTNGSLLVKKI